MADLDDTTVRRARLRVQWASARTRCDPLHIVRRLVVVQSQDRLAASLGVWSRGTGFTAADVERLRTDDRALTRTWLHRQTIQLLATEDLGWLTALLGPRAARAAQSAWRQLGLDEATRDRGRRVLLRALAHGPLTRAALDERFRAAGIDPSGRRLPHLLIDAALEGVVCDGPDHGAQRSWVLRDDWARPPAGPRGEQAATELARRYLKGHGPAAAEDFATWSGLPLGVARTAFRALGGALGELSWRGQTLAHLGGRPRAGAGTGTVLLPAFDAYLLGYRRRPHTLPADTPWPVFAGGMVRPLILRDGRTVGTWAPRRQGQRVRVVLQPFEQGDRPAEKLERVGALVADLARYLGRTVPVEFGESG